MKKTMLLMVMVLLSIQIWAGGNSDPPPSSPPTSAEMYYGTRTMRCEYYYSAQSTVVGSACRDQYKIVVDYTLRNVYAANGKITRYTLGGCKIISDSHHYRCTFPLHTIDITAHSVSCTYNRSWKITLEAEFDSCAVFEAGFNVDGFSCSVRQEFYGHFTQAYTVTDKSFVGDRI